MVITMKQLYILLSFRLCGKTTSGTSYKYELITQGPITLTMFTDTQNEATGFTILFTVSGTQLSYPSGKNIAHFALSNNSTIIAISMQYVLRPPPQVANDILTSPCKPLFITENSLYYKCTLSNWNC